MAAHEHTGHCAQRSQYVMVRVHVIIGKDGRADLRVGMKPGGACWADVETTTVLRGLRVGAGLPLSEEQAADMAMRALEQGYPTLF